MEVVTYSDDKFKENFRMTRVTFARLVNKLNSLYACDTNMKKGIPLNKRITIALYTLGSSAEYRTIASLFGIGRTTTGEIVLDSCTTVCDLMQKEYISLYPPTDEELHCIVSGFEKMGFPQCMGAIGSKFVMSYYKMS